MIVLTVKTLDSQNHTFTVDDDITVEDFKAKIADTVNIPAETQRIIYCGRVLQDNAKLNDYDVNGKVVHLVQRPPPSQNAPTNRAASPQPQRRPGWETANTMYLGSMAFPSNLMESQGIVPPPPTHSLAGSRLNVARRMLRRAEAVITLLENPSARPGDQPAADEQQEDEVTPIIEARVIVPQGNNEPIDEAMVLSAVQNTLFDATSGAIPMAASNDAATTSSAATVAMENSTSSGERSASSTPEEAAPPDTNTETNNSRPLAENASRTTEMAELLTMLARLQERFAPFLQRYQQFMEEDPVVPQENVRQTQALLTRVSEVLHFLGHAYHSLSDIIIRVRTPPPRPLLCRPILIQHSAVVQAGIPIQVEAQFNLTTDRLGGDTTTTAVTTATTTSTTTTAGGAVNNQPTVNIRSFPFIPGASMRVQSFPVEVRTSARPVTTVAGAVRTTTVPPPSSSSTPTTRTSGVGSNNNNNADAVRMQQQSSTATTTPSSGGGGSRRSTVLNYELPLDSAFNPLRYGNNPNLEFFMEITPEALQGSVAGAAAAAAAAPPPEFIQSLVHMAGHLMTARVTNIPTSTTNSTSDSTSSSTSSSSSTQNNSGQNSQARGNTQTNPTTATHTRSTPRPHVHLAQQAMQGGFDPFLPCNSHHVTHRRRGGNNGNGGANVRHNLPQQQQDQQQQQQQRQESDAETRRRERERTANQSLHNLFDEIYSSLRAAYRRRREPNRSTATAAAARDPAAVPTTTTSSSSSTTSAAGSSGGDSGQAPPIGSFLSQFGQALSNFPTMFQSTTIADVLQMLPPDPNEAAPGESIISDFVTICSRHLTIVDMLTLTSGNYDALNRLAPEMESYVYTRLLNNSRLPPAVNAAVERIMSEIQPFLQNFSRLEVRDNIDIVRSIEALFRRKISEILLTLSHITVYGGPQTLIQQFFTLSRLTCGIALYASHNGQQGVENVFQQILESYMVGIPVELRNWSLETSRANLRQYINNIQVTQSEFIHYIVRRNSDVTVTSVGETNEVVPTQQQQQQTEAMDFDDDDEVVATTTTTSTTVESETTVVPLRIGGSEESDTAIGGIVMGSETWHGQVPDDWVPIITRDVQRQRRQNPQAPFSDAYLSGMPTKRRKIVNSTKPQGTLPQVISESVRRAVTASGLTGAAPLEVVCQGAGDSVDVQGAYRSLLRTTVQTALRDNEDFTPERFPNATTYFKQ